MTKLSKSTFIGIDKAIIKGFTITLMDMDKLTLQPNIRLYEDIVGVAVPTSKEEGVGINIGYLKITDDEVFNTLAIGIKKNKGVILKYSYIDLPINKGSSNLLPLDAIEYAKHIQQLQEHLKEKYGLYIDFSKSYFDEIEINKTALMDNPFKDYGYILSFMASLVPSKYETSLYKKRNNNRKRELKEICFYNGSLQGKLYDKTKQLQEHLKITLENNWMRIEYTLKGQRKVESALGSRDLFKITDEAIKDFLDKQINADLIAPLQKYIKLSSKKLLLMATQEKEADKKRWTKNFLLKAKASTCTTSLEEEDLPLLVDLEQAKACIKELAPSHASRTFKRLEKELEDKTYINNLKNFQEIIAKFM